MPLTSMVLAPAVRWAGDLPWAAAPAVAWTAALGAFYVAIALRAVGDPWLALAGALGLLLQSRVLLFAPMTDSAPLHAALLLLALLLYDAAVRSGRAAASFALGLVLGLAVLTRSDTLGTLLAGAPLLAAATWMASARGPSLRSLGWIALGAAVVVLPWVARCLVGFGTPLSPVAGRVTWFFGYSDLYAWSSEPGARAYLERMRAAPSLLIPRLLAVPHVLAQEIGALGRVWAIPSLLGALLWVRGRSPLALATIALLLGHALSYGLLAPALARPLNARGLLPATLVGNLFLLVLVHAALGGLRDRTWRAGPPGRRRAALLIHAPAGGAVLAAALLAVPRWSAPGEPRGTDIRRDFRVLDEALQRLGHGDDEVVLTAQPWQLCWATRRPAVSIPSDGLDAILDAARHFDSDVMAISPSSLPLGRSRDDLEALLRGERRHDRLVLAESAGPWRIYRLGPPADAGTGGGAGPPGEAVAQPSP
jgi:hypothetical protein